MSQFLQLTPVALIRRKKKSKIKKSNLSFALDDEEEEDEVQPIPKKKVVAAWETINLSWLIWLTSQRTKDPSVNTAFLPDREREEIERKERERLKMEWIEEQDKIKQESVTITYSYWDGVGHRRSVEVCTSCGCFDCWFTVSRSPLLAAKERCTY